MKASPQALAGAAALLLAVLVAVPVILGGGGSYPTPIAADGLSVPMPADAQVLPAALALDPVVASSAGPRARNPFNLRPEASRIRTELPLPPPPAMRLPAPMLLPVQGEGGP